MTTKLFQFSLYGTSEILRPQIPLDLPITPNVCAVIDSGASKSLIPMEILIQEKQIIEPHSPPFLAEGICGNPCLRIAGVSKPISFKVSDFPKPFSLQFNVVAPEHKLDSIILGCDFLTHVNVAFKKEAGKQVIELSD